MASIVFDLDGTLTDSRTCILDSIRYAFRKIKLGDLLFNEIRATQHDLRITLREAMTENHLKYEERYFAEFMEHYRWYHRQEGEATIQLYEGTEEVLDSLRSQFKLAVATTKQSKQAIRVLRLLKIDHYFDHIQGTDPGFRYKPDPDILVESMRKLGQPMNKGAYVGDSLHDMKAAQSGGMKRLGAAYGFAGDKHLKDHELDWLLYDIRDLIELQSDVYSRLMSA